MEHKKINFKDLKNEVGRSIIITALDLKIVDKKDSINDMNKYFSERGLFGKDVKILDLIKIVGQKKPRTTDYLIKLTNFNIDPIKRIMEFSYIKWVEDFIDNNKKRYLNDWKEFDNEIIDEEE